MKKPPHKRKPGSFDANVSSLNCKLGSCDPNFNILKRILYFFDTNLNSLKSASLNSEKRNFASNLNSLKRKLEFSKVQTSFFRCKIQKDGQVSIKRMESTECASLIQCPCLKSIISNLAVFFRQKVLSYYSVKLKNYSHMYNDENAENADKNRIILIYVYLVW